LFVDTNQKFTAWKAEFDKINKVSNIQRQLAYDNTHMSDAKTVNSSNNFMTSNYTESTASKQQIAILPPSTGSIQIALSCKLPDDLTEIN
jgi:hypothetical protein